MAKVLARDEEKNEKLLAQPTLVTANINHSEYLQIPETNFIITEYEPEWTKGFNYETSHKTVLQKGLEMPTPALFMPHFVNVVNAYHHESRLYDAAGNEVTGDRLNKLYKKLTSDCWGWLNAKFVPGTGFNNTDLETITGLDAQANLLTKREPLERCLVNDCFIDFKFNKQGLAMSNAKSREQEYERGENIYFFYPRKNYVARFWAGSCRAGLYCDWYPNGSDLNLDWYPRGSVALLGVFCVCEAKVRQ